MIPVSDFLESFRLAGKLADIDVMFASFIGRQTNGSPSLTLLAALVSNAASMRGEIALPVESVWTKAALRDHLKALFGGGDAGAALHGQPGGGPDAPDVDGFVDALDWPPSPAAFPHVFREIRAEDAGSGASGAGNAEPDIFAEAASAAPLVLANGLLYLGRMYRNEELLRAYLLSHSDPVPPLPEPIDFGKVTELALEEEQKAAVSAAVNSRFLAISGGPGTGKTTIVSVILALRNESPDEIVLCAPTGKAQVRMKESLNRQLKTLCDAKRGAEIAGIRSFTIHRLLSWNRGEFRCNGRNRLPYKLIIVDECSMIDLSLMAALLKAVRDDASLVLLGDRCQLSSVDPGSVFGDVCGFLRARHPDHLVELVVSRRFPEGGEICNLKNAVNDGRAADAWDYLTRKERRDAVRAPLPARQDLEGFLREQSSGSWLGADGRPYHLAETVDEAWDLFGQFRILAPMNGGVFGTDNLNAAARSILGFAPHGPGTRFRSPEAGPLMPGETVLVLRNDSRLNVFNGDVGILWFADENGAPVRRSDRGAVRDPKRLLVFFPVFADAPGWHGLPLEVLPEHAPAYAFTIHKSQGSDYRRVLMFLPPAAGPGQSLLTREIVYTGLTRARERVVIAAEEDTFLSAVGRCTDRVSGLGNMNGPRSPGPT